LSCRNVSLSLLETSRNLHRFVFIRGGSLLEYFLIRVSFTVRFVTWVYTPCKYEMKHAAKLAPFEYWVAAVVSLFWIHAHLCMYVVYMHISPCVCARTCVYMYVMYIHIYVWMCFILSLTIFFFQFALSRGSTPPAKMRMKHAAKLCPFRTLCCCCRLVFLKTRAYMCCICTNVCVCLHVHIYIYIHTNIYTYMYI